MIKQRTTHAKVLHTHAHACLCLNESYICLQTAKTMWCSSHMQMHYALFFSPLSSFPQEAGRTHTRPSFPSSLLTLYGSLARESYYVFFSNRKY